jgi:hypothetical protein
MNKMNKNNLEPVYSNIFSVEAEWPYNVNDDNVINGNIFSFTENIKYKHIQIGFMDSLDENNAMIVYPYLMFLKNDKIFVPKITTTMFNKKGDQFAQFIYINCKVVHYDDLNLAYQNENNLFNINAKFSFEKCKKIFNGYTPHFMHKQFFPK